jgi:hypothetical protein
MNKIVYIENFFKESEEKLELSIKYSKNFFIVSEKLG